MPYHRRPSSPALFGAVLAILALLILVAATLWLRQDPHGSAGAAATLPGGVTGAAGPGTAAGQLGASPVTPTVQPSPSITAGTPGVSGPTKAPAGQRLVTFVNRVDQTVWVAGWQQTPQPALGTTGWVLPAGRSLSITVPDKWNGRFWGRTGCSFNSAGHGHCETGDCAGRFQCRQYGQIPATLAEYNLNSWQNLDFYDVSLVDGANLPMWINITRGGTRDPVSATGCAPAGCTKAVPCPAELTVTTAARAVGCISPCARFGTDQYCCRGQWAPRSACDPTGWPVDYAAIFKKAEPFAYSYVDDDATSTFTCKAECDYRITFGVSP